MFKNLFKKKAYLNCPYMKNSIHFFYDNISACCTNVNGPVFYPDYKGELVDWNEVYKKRKAIIKKIKSPFRKEVIPECCKGCCDANQFLSDTPPDNFVNEIQIMYFHNNMSCNAKCTYCTYSHIERGYRYLVVPLVKSLIQSNLLSKNTRIYMSGGEITISKEFEDLLSILINHVESRIEILSSGIKYCESIKEAFRQNISLDSGGGETYKTIKQLDCFDKVIENIKTYLSVADSAKDNIILKYILIDGVNDNKKELENFLNTAKDLGINNVRLDFDYEKYRFTEDITVPEYYFELYDFFNTEVKKRNLNALKCTQIEAILNKSK